MKRLTDASVTTAWVIVANKPFYPLYVWWLVGAGVRASLWTLAALPLFAALPPLARRAPLAARALLPLVGLADTAFSIVAFGANSGVAAFLAPCAALAALSFISEEAWVSRALTLAALALFAAVLWLAPPGLWPWPPESLGAFVRLNLYCAAALTAFVGLRFASVR